MNVISITMLRRMFSYDSVSGLIHWKRSHKNGVAAGDVAGRVDLSTGYVRLTFRRQTYKAHRVIWALVYAEWPTTDIDHINGDRADNKLENLRLASRTENIRSMKKRKNSACGLKGVTPYKKQSDKFVAQIRVNGKQQNLGVFNSQQRAHDAYCEAATIAFGRFFNPDCLCHHSGAVVTSGIN